MGHAPVAKCDITAITKGSAQGAYALASVFVGCFTVSAAVWCIAFTDLLVSMQQKYMMSYIVQCKAAVHM